MFGLRKSLFRNPKQTDHTIKRGYVTIGITSFILSKIFDIHTYTRIRHLPRRESNVITVSLKDKRHPTNCEDTKLHKATLRTFHTNDRQNHRKDLYAIGLFR